MLNRIKARLDNNFSALLLWGVATVTFVISKIIQTQWLDKSYSDSKFPVPFYEGQTTFNALETKKHFQVLLDNNTLDIFWQTQFIDFMYIIATFIFTLVVMIAIYKTLSFSAKLQKFSWIMVFLMPLNTIMDVLENLISFIMLSNPTDFADWLIIPYSSFAVAKFALYFIGYLWIISALSIKLVHSLRSKK